MSTTRPDGMQDSFFDYGIASFMSTVGACGFQDSLFDCGIAQWISIDLMNGATAGLNDAIPQSKKESGIP